MKKKWEIWFRYERPGHPPHKVSDIILELTDEEMLEILDFMTDPYDLRKAQE